MLAPLQQQIQQTQQLLAQCPAALPMMSSRSSASSARQYKDIDLTGSQRAMVQGAEERWQDSVAAFEDALKVQAGAVGNIEGARSAVQSLVTASQSATGALQAAQAGNQLLALQSQQLADLTATVASARPRAVARCRQCGRGQGAGARAAPPLPRAGTRLCPDHRPDVPELRRWTPSSSRGSEPGRSSPSR